MKTFSALRKLENDTKAEVFLVGGFVRDFVRRKRNKDIDVVVRYLTLKKIRTFLEPLGTVKELTIHRNHGAGAEPVKFVSFVGDDGIEAQIAVVKGSGKDRNPNATLRQDSMHRDFTISAMYLPICNLTYGAIFDPHGGRNDIKAKQILTIGSAAKTFRKSPIRILRAFSLAARMNYTISNHVQAAIQSEAKLLKDVPAEAIRAEFEEVLLSAKPSKYLKLMQRLGVFEIIIPELEEAARCKQDKRYHKYNVFEHLIYSCDYSDDNLILRLAALFHDIGKPVVRAEASNRVTFHKHEVVGAKLTGVILRRLKYDKATIKAVTHLVRMHMYHYGREWTDAAVRRFITAAGITEDYVDKLDEFPLFLLRGAERLGNGFKKERITPKQRDFQERISSVFKASAGFGVKDLAVNGTDLMEVFNIPPGEMVGNILKHLVEIIMDDPAKNNREDLLREALEFRIQQKGD